MEPRTIALVKKTFAGYLAQPEWKWTLFVTQTFDVHKCGYLKKGGGWALHRDICEESFDRFLLHAAQSSQLVYGFGFEEKHKFGQVHWHALVHIQEDLFGEPSRTSLWRYMFNMYGRNEVRAFEHGVNVQVDSQVACVSDGISRYLCKYVAKEGFVNESWWDFSGFMGGYVVDALDIAGLLGIRTADSDQKEADSHGTF